MTAPAPLTEYQMRQLASLDRAARHLLATERARLLNQPVQAPDGRLGIVDSVHTNVHGDVLGHVLGWKSYPATYYAETLTVVGKE